MLACNFCETKEAVEGRKYCADCLKVQEALLDEIYGGPGEADRVIGEQVRAMFLKPNAQVHRKNRP